MIHNSFDFLPLTYSDLVDTPVITTIHGFSSEQIVPVFEKYNARGYYVAISDSDRHERLDYVATIHHGIDMHEFERGGGAGRLPALLRKDPSREGDRRGDRRGPKADLPLIIAGIIQDQEYFERSVKPRLDGRRVTLPRPRRSRSPPRAPRRRASAPPSRQLRRAVRLQRRRGDGLRNAGDRPSPRIDA